MNTKRVILATEDTLSEAVSTRILINFSIEIVQYLGNKGNQYLRQKAPNFNQAAKGGTAIFMLTDLDSPDNCPPQLIRSWIKATQNPEFLFRVAVMEVESWIMADRRGVAEFLSIPLNRIPPDVDAISNPKEYLVSLARQSKKNQLRGDIVPKPGSTSKVGPGYNSQFSMFVHNQWNLHNAAAISKSLKRTLDRLREFTET